MMKPLSPFVLKIFKFMSWLLIVQKDALIRKARLISKFLPSQPGKQTIAIHILLNISKSKSLTQLNLVSWKNISWETFFLKNHIQYVVEDLFCFVSLHIQSECGKIRTRITPNTDTFYAVFFASIPVDSPSFSKIWSSTYQLCQMFTFKKMKMLNIKLTI